MENMPATDSNTWFFTEFAREANAAELALSSCHKYTILLIGIDGGLNTFFVKTR